MKNEALRIDLAKAAMQGLLSNGGDFSAVYLDPNTNQRTFASRVRPTKPSGSDDYTVDTVACALLMTGEQALADQAFRIADAMLWRMENTPADDNQIEYGPKL